MISNIDGDVYLALFQLVRMFHPARGQATAQLQQPIHSRAQPFAEHISHGIDYYQSEECSGWLYTQSEKIIRDAMKRKYMNMVPQNGPIPSIPMECK
jgi:hypothetical protein